MERMTKEELEKELEKLKDFKLYTFEGDVYVKAEDYKKIAIENRKLKEDNGFLTKISKEYMKKENIIEVTEFTELYKNDLEEENKELKEHKENLIRADKKKTEHIDELEEEIKKLKETIKDHQLYEEKLEHRIIEFEELLHGE